MRVLLVSERFPPQKGGVAVAALRNALHAAAWLEHLDVVHLSSDLEPGEARGTNLAPNVMVHTLGRASREEESLQILEQSLRALLRGGSHDLVHAFFAGPTATAALLAARMAGRPTLVSVRGNDVDRGPYDRGRAAMLMWTLAQADRVACVSREQVDKVRALTGRSDLVYTPNSVDGQVFYPEPGPGGSEPVLMFSGLLRFKKGMAPLLEAVARLSRSSRPVRLVLLGGVDPSAREAYERWRARHPQAATRVSEVAYDPDPGHLRRHLGQADLVILPSLWEGMSNAVLEAMACARPVLATPAGGNRDLLEEGRTGWLIDLEDLHHLPERIAQILALPAAEREAVGRRAREFVLAHHRPEQEAGRLRELYRSLVPSAPGS